jgi:hypothetical protein
MAYNYMETVKDDVRDWIENEIDLADYPDRDDLEQQLNDDLWVEDSVTGNGSGSYTFSRAAAEENVKGDPKAMDYIKDMCDEWDIPASDIGEKFLAENWEYFDVSIRCYLLGQAISEVLDELY